jgi:predicted nuclease of predicted toxin-antitoxin system
LIYFQIPPHLRTAGFEGETPDEVIWQFAKENGFTILTSDRDFVAIAERYGHPPKLIRYQRMNYRTRFAAELIRGNAVLSIDSVPWVEGDAADARELETEPET